MPPIWIITWFSILVLNFSHLGPLPKVFVIGDSISMQYGPYLEKHLKGFYEYDRKRDDGIGGDDLDNPQGANGGNSSVVLDYLRKKLRQEHFVPDLLLLNCGLHDIKRNPSGVFDKVKDMLTFNSKKI